MSDKFFHRGKEARSRGLPREVHDGRMSAENRQKFYAGWDDQDRHMQPTLTPEQETERDESLAGIRAFLADSGFKSKRTTNQ